MEESSSDSDWDSDSSRGLNTCGVSRVVHCNRFSVSGDASNDTRCLEELERNQVPMPCTNHLDHQVGPSRRFEERGTTSVIAHRLVKQGDVNLRQWLDRPERLIDHLECLHIFRQIVEIVNLAHAQGIIVRNVRPSCFVMSASNRVSFIESASCSSTSSGSCEDAMNDRFFKKGQCSSPLTHELQEKIRLDDASQPPCSGDSRRNYGCLLLSSTNGMYQNAIEDIEERKIQDGRNVEEVEGSKDKFPMKQVMIKEVSWYTTPEEVAGGPTSFYSDVYRLGVLLFELFCTCSSTEKKLSTMSNLRHRVLPPQLLLNWPKEASFCLWLLHPLPSTRPKMIEVLQSDFLNEPSHSWEEGEDAIKLREEMEGNELLLEFLLQMQQRKEEVVDQLQDNICCLSSDIKEILKKQLFLNKTGASYSELNKTDYSSLENIYYPVPNPIRYENLPNFGSRKRLRSGNKMIKEEKHEYHGDIPKSETQKDNQGNIPSKNTRLIKNFKILESAYFSKRSRMIKSTEKTLTRGSKISSSGRESFSITDRSSVNKLGSNEGHSEGRSGLLDPFLDGLCKYLSFSKMKVRAELKQGDLLNSSSLVCSLSFDRDNEFFATAGVNQKIKVFEYNMILNEDHDIHYHYPVTEMASRSKMSSICWNSYIKSQIASSDFEGVVQIWDATRGQVYMEMKEHKRRAWSVDFSSSDPTKLASGSDDGAVKLWNINQGGSISTIKLKANVCCVQFPPDSAHSLVFGSADHKVYCYDLRNTKMPWCTLIGHEKTVSYVKFIDSTTLVSASTDNTLKLWDLSTCTSRVLDNPVQTFTGHTNKKNFVGLSLCDGYIATGSETNEVFVYHKSLPMPVLSYKFSSDDSLSGQEVDDYSHFISSVCWRDQSSTLVAANSAGDIKLLEMV